MFRKPKQRNLRGRTEHENNEDEQTDVPETSATVPHPPQTITTTTTTTTTVIKTVVKKADAPKSLLSFGDDEGKEDFFCFELVKISMGKSR